MSYTSEESEERGLTLDSVLDIQLLRGNSYALVEGIAKKFLCPRSGGIQLALLQILRTTLKNREYSRTLKSTITRDSPKGEGASWTNCEIDSQRRMAWGKSPASDNELKILYSA